MRLDQIHAAADATRLLVYCVVVPNRLTPKAWIHAHERGLLVRIHHGVSRPVDTPETPDLLIAAAIAAARPAAGTNRALASGRAGAFALGISVPPLDPVHVVVAGRTPHRPLAGVAIHRPRNHLDLIGHGPGDRIPHTRATRILLDVAAWRQRVPEVRWRAVRAALRPLAPQTPAPGKVAAPVRYRPCTGVV